MHPTELPADLQAHMIARHGRRHRFIRLDPERCALVVIDMQRIFCAEGALLEVPEARAIVPAINRMAQAMRAAGGTVAWVRSAFPPSDRDWHVMFDAVMPPGFGAQIRAGLQHGQPDYAFFGGLAPEPGDIEADKDRFSAFLPGACPLPDKLRARHRHGADCRHHDQCLLRELCARRDDGEFPRHNAVGCLRRALG